MSLLQFLNNGYFAGKVGIGTDSPSFQLSIENHATTTSVATMEIDGKRTDGNDGAVGELIFSNNGDTFATVAGVRDGADNKGSLQFQTQDSAFATRMTISSEGNVGIGLTNPQSKLEVAGGAQDFQLRYLTTEKRTYFGTNSSGNLQVYAYETGVGYKDILLAVDNGTSAGNVGIGTDSPDEKLDVAGKVQVTGTSLTVLNASDPIIQVSDTDTNYKGAMRWLSSDNVLEFYTRYAGTYYTSNLVLDRGSVGIGTNSPNALLEVDSITYSANNAIANFVNGNDPVRVAYDTVVIAQTDVPCLSIVETIDGSQANEQKLSFSVGDNKAIIRSSATAISGLYINVAGTNTAPGYNTADGLNAIRVLNNGNTAFNYKVGIGTTNPILKLHIEGTNSLPATSGIAQNGGIRIENGVNNGVLDIGASNATGAPGWLQATDKTDLSQAYKLLLNPNGGDVGIGTTTPQSKLQVAGGIQMADDTATASASKVGTMRYRTGTEYVEVDGVELVTNGDFATDTDWTKGTGWTISGGTADAATATSDFTQTVSFTLGQTYRLTYTVSNYSAGAVRTSLGAYVANTPISANGNYTDIFTPTNVSSNSLLYFEGQSGFTGSIDNVSMVEVTSEDASYADMCMQTGASTYEWINIVRNTY